MARSKTAVAPAERPASLLPTLIAVAVIAVLLVGGLIWLNQSRSAATAVTSPGASTIGVQQGKTEEGWPYMGNPNAKVTVVEFSDYQCPHCGNFARETFPKIEDKYIKTGKVKWVAQPFEFLGPESTQAGNAALCALDQGKFWEYEKMLFLNQGGENKGAFSKQHLKEFGQKLGLDTEKFNRCVDSGQHLQQVQASYSIAQGRGVSQTPTFFINGKKVEGNYPFDDFSKMIDEALSKAS